MKGLANIIVKSKDGSIKYNTEKQNHIIPTFKQYVDAVNSKYPYYNFANSESKIIPTFDDNYFGGICLFENNIDLNNPALDFNIPALSGGYKEKSDDTKWRYSSYGGTTVEDNTIRHKWSWDIIDTTTIKALALKTNSFEGGLPEKAGYILNDLFIETGIAEASITPILSFSKKYFTKLLDNEKTKWINSSTITLGQNAVYVMGDYELDNGVYTISPVAYHEESEKSYGIFQIPKTAGTKAILSADYTNNIILDSNEITVSRIINASLVADTEISILCNGYADYVVSYNYTANEISIYQIISENGELRLSKIEDIDITGWFNNSYVKAVLGDILILSDTENEAYIKFSQSTIDITQPRNIYSSRSYGNNYYHNNTCYIKSCTSLIIDRNIFTYSNAQKDYKDNYSEPDIYYIKPQYPEWINQTYINLENEDIIELTPGDSLSITYTITVTE